ncbi:M15 family metallopeptidase [Pandoraea fibrosis]|uniref:Peptidoglycan L-alanyl-D-glutamate endopeptidase CwlK n=1 Tax=Pandoraea fibrosis TaxID=1891094 RepID=A0A5E4XH21_9BURK|nr:M15 family metallopeptidase [Pandoraea fibrosis]VVE35420.1 Peptidoglycan L-alanyl-D-glutamate endopeptidase CwlK [Pandoraea fibrosis]
MTFRLSARSRRNLIGVHPDLVRVVHRAIGQTRVDFCVTEGKRDAARQAVLVRRGVSRTLNSRHLTGHAVDLAAWVDGTVKWDWPLYEQIANAMRLSAEELGVSLVWGGDWKTLKDGPHFELDRNHYP